MELLRFRVKSFRSIKDTDWIEADNVTAFIGTNESGKSNVLLALWKLNPARDGEIDLKADAPRKYYNRIRQKKQKPIFIEAEFGLPDQIKEMLSELTNAPTAELEKAIVSKDLDGCFSVRFPNFVVDRKMPPENIITTLENSRHEISNMQLAGVTEEPHKAAILESLEVVLKNVSTEAVNAVELAQLVEELESKLPEKPLKSSSIIPRFERLLSDLRKNQTILDRPNPSNISEAEDLIIENLPIFVYYANYGNLDSEIYLPHVIDNMKREDLGSKEAAKARTLRVLFDFVSLSAEEILDLGKDIDPKRTPHPTEIEIGEIADKKKEREILLQSASTELTTEFRDFWQQGNHRFRFQADGDHFRIWVADEIRPEEIELEGRSTGLQWFLSFYLIFLVERQVAHQNAILLLDEPGISLHPIAQKDLFDFFNKLSEENQLLYTSHSPFMVDHDHLDRVRAVYFDEDGDDQGLTKVSGDLRAKERNVAEAKSIYPVYAALDLNISPILLQGCIPIIVEGTSDQYYLSAIKNILIGKGLITPEREIIFLPSGSFKGIKAVIPVITGLETELPHVVLDSDNVGKQIAKQLSSELYKGNEDKITLLEEICGYSEAEIEDLYPSDIVGYIATLHLFREIDEEFSDIVKDSQPMVGQIEKFAGTNNITLKLGWKVEIAKRVKQRAMKRRDEISQDTLDKWVKLFELFLNTQQ